VTAAQVLLALALAGAVLCLLGWLAEGPLAELADRILEWLE
jgi:hypothetical protein